MITACILAKNSEKSLPSTLESLRRFDEVILLDTGSTDQTIACARLFPNTVVHQAPFCGFGELRNKAAQLAKNDWILAIDSDELLSHHLEEEILTLTLNPHCIYEIDFWNFYNGKRIFGCGWHPEQHIRLYHRRQTQFSDSSVHEGIIRKPNLNIIRLQHPMIHTPYRSTFDFISKLQLYSELFAEQHRGKRTSSFAKALGHAMGALVKSYLIKRGFLMGKEGAIISWYNANVAFYKYLKLAEDNQKRL